MAESQSRYGIMQELNNRKIKEKEKLANIEREIDQLEYDNENKVETLNNSIKRVEDSFEREYKERSRVRTLNLTMLKGDYERKKSAIENEQTEDDSSYVKVKDEFVESQNKQIKSIKAEIARQKDVYATKIKDKEAIIQEIENGIASLKDMSAGVEADGGK